MNLDSARRLADTVLYEGYVLYPYRASAQKNHSRWQFGVLMPAGYLALDEFASAATQTECVIDHSGRVSVEVLVRFLQIQRRSVRCRQPDGSFLDADALPTPDGPVLAWDEAVEQEITVVVEAEALSGDGVRHEFNVAGGAETELVRDRDGTPLGQVIRRRSPLTGVVTVTAEPLAGPWRAMRLRVRVENLTPLTDVPTGRDSVLPASFVAAHTVIGVAGGGFLSMVDPPEWARPHVEACVNTGTWPVLAGPAGRRDLLLSAPIILYDHAELAPESPGDLYDATEIDEILTLRTMTLSDEEKREARATDPRAAAVIDRVDAMAGETLERLHGAIRYLRNVTGPDPASQPDTPWWDPDADASVAPHTDTVEVGGRLLSRGSRVRLRPGARRADAQDMFLTGRVAVIEAVLLDIEDNRYLAVTLADDPAADLQRSHGRYLYFTPDEVEYLPAGRVAGDE